MLRLIQTLVFCGAIAYIHVSASAMQPHQSLSCVTLDHKISSAIYHPIWGLPNSDDKAVIRVFTDQPKSSEADSPFGLGDSNRLEVFLLSASIIRAGLLQSHPSASLSEDESQATFRELITTARRLLQLWPDEAIHFSGLMHKLWRSQAYPFTREQIDELEKIILSDQELEFASTEHSILARDFLLELLIEALLTLPLERSDRKMVLSLQSAHESNSMGRAWTRATSRLVHWYLASNISVINEYMCLGKETHRQVVFLIPDSIFALEFRRQLSNLNPK